MIYSEESLREYKNSVIRSALGLVICLIAPFTTFAGEAPESDNTGISAQVSAQYQYDDNILSDRNNIIDSYVFMLRPEVSWLVNSGTNQFQVRFSNETAKYEESSEDNYSDTSLGLNANIEFTAKHRLSVSAATADSHQNRGTGFNIGDGQAQNEVDTFNQNDLSLRYSYGRESTAAQLDFYYSISSVNFDQRLDDLGNDRTLIRDRQDSILGAEFSYAMTAKTSLVLDLNHSELDYDVETGLGNTVDALLVGVSWQASAKTRGRVLIGRQDRELVLGGSSDNGIWQIGVEWSPKSYSTFSFSSSKSNQASIGIGNGRTATSTSISWNHAWSSQISSNVIYSIQDTNFIGTNSSTESDTTDIRLSYLLDSNMSISFSYRSSDRTSDSLNNQFMFNREVIGISFSMAFN